MTLMVPRRQAEVVSAQFRFISLCIARGLQAVAWATRGFSYRITAVRTISLCARLWAWSRICVKGTAPTVQPSYQR